MKDTSEASFHGQKNLLRFLTAGSVDDGKSTLIGRLLYEAGGVYEDQLSSVRRVSGREFGGLDLSLITDGLKCEREQAITIDVAYRYFSTAQRKFIITDCPGHQQYTCNMVTGASTAEVALILIDARKGLLEQTRRHTYIAWLLGIRQMVVTVNKMDLVNFDQGVFSHIRDQFIDCTTSFINGVTLNFVPVSALEGDNVVQLSARMPWYQGPSLLTLLEELPLERQHKSFAFRFPIQNVIRPNQDFRGYAGQIASGIVRPGQGVIALPSLQRASVQEIHLHTRSLKEAFSPMSVVLLLSDHIDLGRGEMLVDPERMPMISKRVIVSLIWMSQKPLLTNSPYLVRHTTQVLCGSVTEVRSKLDFNSFDIIPTSTLNFNEVGIVELETHKPLFWDPYLLNRSTGSLIIIDPRDNNTVGAGLILEPPTEGVSSKNEAKFAAAGSDRQHQGITVWFTGLSGSGKTTISNSVYTELVAHGYRVEILDGDDLRKQLNSDLGFSKQDRDENVRRIGFVAQLLTRNGVVALVSAISPYRAIRDEVRCRIGGFLEIYVNAPLTVCEQRDPKGLYRKARAGELPGFTGIDDPYEPPLAPEVQCETDQESLKICTDKVVSAVFALRPLARSNQ